MNKQDILRLYGINSYDTNNELARELSDNEIKEFQAATQKLADSFKDIFADSYAENDDEIQHLKERSGKSIKGMILFVFIHNSFVIVILEQHIKGANKRKLFKNQGGYAYVKYENFQ